MEKQKPIYVFTICDFEFIQLGLREAIRTSKDIELCGQAATAAEALEGHASCLKKADVLILDVDSQTHSHGPTHVTSQLGVTRVLYLASETSSYDLDSIREVLQLESFGFLLKTGSATDILSAVRHVAHGRMVCEVAAFAEVFQRLMSSVDTLSRFASSGEAGSNSSGDLAHTMSEREEEVMGLILEGLSNKEIADRLLITESTVKYHVSGLMGKFNVDRRIDLIKRVLLTDSLPHLQA